MKKVFTTIVTVILVAAIALGALIAYDEYIQRRDRLLSLFCSFNFSRENIFL